MKQKCTKHTCVVTVSFNWIKTGEDSLLRSGVKVCPNLNSKATFGTGGEAVVVVVDTVVVVGGVTVVVVVDVGVPVEGVGTGVEAVVIVVGTVVAVSGVTVVVFGDAGVPIKGGVLELP